ncbi:hypothetical protein NC651_011424 [Populus alba x Populus x berolinensis]|nr:hypothetical protein NC651_011424 [Populus alba x Populus x berolinensis]
MSILFQQQGELNAKNGEPKASSSISEATTEKQRKEPDQLHSSSSASLSQQSHEPASELEEQPGEPMQSSENGDINSPRQENCSKGNLSSLKHGRWKLFQSPQKPRFGIVTTARNACFRRPNIHKHYPDKDSMHKIPPDATCHKK